MVYELVKPAGSGLWTFVTLYTFCSVAGCADGNDPFAGLTYAGAADGDNMTARRCYLVKPLWAEQPDQALCMPCNSPRAPGRKSDS